MTVKSKILQKIYAYFALICFISTLAPAPGVFADTEKAAKFPSELGTLRETFQGSSGKSVVLIQDAHANYDAQTSIRKLIDHFQKKSGINFVALEGGSGPLDLGLLRAFPDQKSKEFVMNEYVRAGELSGAEMAAVVNITPSQYMGIEDAGLYEENKKAFFAALKEQKKHAAEFSKIRAELDQRSLKVDSPELRKLRTRKVEALADLAKEQKIDIKKFSGLDQIVDALKEKLFQSEAQRALDREFQRFEALERISGLEATREDLRFSAPFLKEFKIDLKHALKFYDLAFKRDQIFADKLLALNQSTIFVGGGFHTDGIKQKLKQAGISYQIITPKISTVGSSENYLKVMRGEVSYAHPRDLETEIAAVGDDDAKIVMRRKLQEWRMRFSGVPMAALPILDRQLGIAALAPNIQTASHPCHQQFLDAASLRLLIQSAQTKPKVTIADAVEKLEAAFGRPGKQNSDISSHKLKKSIAASSLGESVQPSKEKLRAKIALLEDLKHKIEKNTLPELVYFGDKHGTPSDLEEVVAIAKRARARGTKLHIIGHGDAFDRGFDNVGVWRIFRQLKKMSEKNPNIRVTFLLGNHETSLIRDQLMKFDPMHRLKWRGGMGGDMLVREFKNKYGDDHIEKLKELAIWALENSRLYEIDEAGILHVHAGIPTNESGQPLVALPHLEDWQAELEEFQGKLRALGSLAEKENWFAASHPAYGITNGEALLELFIESNSTRNVRPAKWLDFIPKKQFLFFLAELGVNGIVVGHQRAETLRQYGDWIFLIDAGFDTNDSFLTLNPSGLVWHLFGVPIREIYDRKRMLTLIGNEIAMLQSMAASSLGTKQNAVEWIGEDLWKEFTRLNGGAGKEPTVFRLEGTPDQIKSQLKDGLKKLIAEGRGNEYAILLIKSRGEMANVSNWAVVADRASEFNEESAIKNLSKGIATIHTYDLVTSLSVYDNSSPHIPAKISLESISIGKGKNPALRNQKFMRAFFANRAKILEGEFPGEDIGGHILHFVPAQQFAKYFNGRILTLHDYDPDTERKLRFSPPMAIGRMGQYLNPKDPGDLKTFIQNIEKAAEASKSSQYPQTAEQIFSGTEVVVTGTIKGNSLGDQKYAQRWLGKDLWNAFKNLNAGKDPEIIRLSRWEESAGSELKKKLEAMRAEGRDDEYVIVFMDTYDSAYRTEKRIIVADQVKELLTEENFYSLSKGNVGIGQFDLVIAFTEYEYPRKDRPFKIIVDDISIGKNDDSPLRGQKYMRAVFEHLTEYFMEWYPGEKIGADAVVHYAIVKWMAKAFNGRIQSISYYDKQKGRTTLYEAPPFEGWLKPYLDVQDPQDARKMVENMEAEASRTQKKAGEIFSTAKIKLHGTIPDPESDSEAAAQSLGMDDRLREAERAARGNSGDGGAHAVHLRTLLQASRWADIREYYFKNNLRSFRHPTIEIYFEEASRNLAGATAIDRKGSVQFERTLSVPPMGLLERQYTGNLAMGLDGNTMAFGVDDQEFLHYFDSNFLNFFDLNSGTRSEMREGIIRSCITPDARRALAFNMETFLLFDLENRRVLKSILSLPYQISANEVPMCLSENGYYAAIKTKEGKKQFIHVFETEYGEEISKTEISSNLDQRPITLSPDGTLLVTTSGLRRNNTEYSVYHLPSGERMVRRSISIGDAFFSPSGNELVVISLSSSDHEPIRVWDMASGKPLPTPKINSPSKVRFTADGSKFLVVDGSDESSAAVLFETRTGKELRRFVHRRGIEGSTLVAELHPSEKYVITAGKGDNDIRVWDIETGKQVNSFRRRSTEGTPKILITSDGSRILAATHQGNIDVFRILKNSELPEPKNKRAGRNSKAASLGVSAPKDLILKRIQQLKALKENITENKLPKLVYFGDKHGDTEDLNRIVELAKRARADKSAIHIIGHGDGFDRGSDNLAVWQAFQELTDIAGDHSNVRVSLLFGNHDLVLIMANLLKPFKANRDHWYDMGGRSVAREFKRVFGPDEIKRELLRLVFWMLEHFKLYEVDEAGILHVHAGIPLGEDGKPGISLKDLESWQKELDFYREELSRRKTFENKLKFFFETTAYGGTHRENLIRIFEKIKKAATIRSKEWVRPMKNADIIHFLAHLGVNCIMVGHNRHEKLKIRNKRIFQIDVGDSRNTSHLIFDRGEFTFDTLDEPKQTPISRVSFLKSIDDEIQKLTEEASGKSLGQLPVKVWIHGVSGNEPVQLEDAPKTAGELYKRLMERLKAMNGWMNRFRLEIKGADGSGVVKHSTDPSWTRIGFERGDEVHFYLLKSNKPAQASKPAPAVQQPQPKIEKPRKPKLFKQSPLLYFVIKPANFDWEKYEPRLPKLENLDLGLTNSAGRIDFRAANNCQYPWRVLPFDEEGWRVVIKDAWVRGKYFQIQLEMTKEGREPIIRNFLLGPFTRILKQNARSKNPKSFKFLDIIPLEGAAASGLSQLVLQPGNMDLTGLSFNPISPRGIIAFSPVPNYPYDWNPLDGMNPKEREGYRGVVRSQKIQDGYFRFVVEFKKEGSKTFQKTYQIGPYRTNLDGEYGEKGKSISVFEISDVEDLGKKHLYHLLTSPADFNWSDPAAKLPSITGTRLGTTNPKGLIFLVPKTGFQYFWPALGAPEPGWEARVTSSGVNADRYQFEVEFTKLGEPSRRRSFQVGPETRVLKNRKSGDTITVWAIQASSLGIDESKQGDGPARKIGRDLAEDADDRIKLQRTVNEMVRPGIERLSMDQLVTLRLALERLVAAHHNERNGIPEEFFVIAKHVNDRLSSIYDLDNERNVASTSMTREGARVEHLSEAVSDWSGRYFYRPADQMGHARLLRENLYTQDRQIISPLYDVNPLPGNQFFDEEGRYSWAIDQHGPIRLLGLEQSRNPIKNVLSESSSSKFNGRYLAYHDDKSLVVLEKQTGNVVHEVTISEILKSRPASKIHKLADVSPDGNKLLLALKNSSVILIDLKSKSVLKLVGRTRAAFTPDGQSIIAVGGSGGDGSEVQVLTSTGKEERVLIDANVRFRQPAGAFAFRPGSSEILVAEAGNYGPPVARIWNYKTGELVRTISTGHYSHIVSIAFSPDGRIVFIGNDLGNIRAWNLDTGIQVINYLSAVRGSGVITRIQIAPDGNSILISSNLDDERKQTQIFHFMPKRGYEQHHARLYPEAQAAGASLGLTERGAAEDAFNRELIRKFRQDKNPRKEDALLLFDIWRRKELNHVRSERRKEFEPWNPAGKLIDQEISNYYDYRGENGLELRPQFESAPQSGEWIASDRDPSGRKIVEWFTDETRNSFRVWDSDNPDLQAAFDLDGEPQEDYTEPFLNGDGKWVVMWNQTDEEREGTFRAWNLENLSAPPITQPTELGGVTPADVVISSDRRRAVTLLNDNKLLLWDLINPAKKPRVLEEFGEEIYLKEFGLQISANGRRAAILDHEGNLHIYDLENSKKRPRILKWDFLGFRLTPDGNRLIGVNHCTEEICIWDLENSRKKAVSVGKIENFDPENMIFSPSGEDAIFWTPGVIFMMDLTKKTIKYEMQSGLIDAAAATEDGKGIIYSGSGRESGSLIKFVPWQSRHHLNFEELYLQLSIPNRFALPGGLFDADNVFDADNEAGRVKKISVSPDNKRAIVIYSSGLLEIWDLVSGQEIARASGIEDYQVAPDWSSIAAVTIEGGVRIYRGQTRDAMLDQFQRELKLSDKKFKTLLEAIRPDQLEAFKASHDTTTTHAILEEIESSITFPNQEDKERIVPDLIMYLAENRDGQSKIAAASLGKPQDTDPRSVVLRLISEGLTAEDMRHFEAIDRGLNPDRADMNRQIQILELIQFTPLWMNRDKRRENLKEMLRIFREVEEARTRKRTVDPYAETKQTKLVPSGAAQELTLQHIAVDQSEMIRKIKNDRDLPVFLFEKTVGGPIRVKRNPEFFDPTIHEEYIEAYAELLESLFDERPDWASVFTRKDAAARYFDFFALSDFQHELTANYHRVGKQYGLGRDFISEYLARAYAFEAAREGTEMKNAARNDLEHYRKFILEDKLWRDKYPRAALLAEARLPERVVSAEKATWGDWNNPEVMILDDVVYQHPDWREIPGQPGKFYPGEKIIFSQWQGRFFVFYSSRSHTVKGSEIHQWRSTEEFTGGIRFVKNKIRENLDDARGELSAFLDREIYSEGRLTVPPSEFSERVRRLHPQINRALEKGPSNFRKFRELRLKAKTQGQSLGVLPKANEFLAISPKKWIGEKLWKEFRRVSGGEKFKIVHMAGTFDELSFHGSSKTLKNALEGIEGNPFVLLVVHNQYEPSVVHHVAVFDRLSEIKKRKSMSLILLGEFPNNYFEYGMHFVAYDSTEERREPFLVFRRASLGKLSIPEKQRGRGLVGETVAQIDREILQKKYPGLKIEGWTDQYAMGRIFLKVFQGRLAISGLNAAPLELQPFLNPENPADLDYFLKRMFESAKVWNADVTTFDKQFNLEGKIKSADGKSLGSNEEKNIRAFIAAMEKNPRNVTNILAAIRALKSSKLPKKQVKAYWTKVVLTAVMVLFAFPPEDQRLVLRMLLDKKDLLIQGAAKHFETYSLMLETRTVPFKNREKVVIREKLELFTMIDAVTFRLEQLFELFEPYSAEILATPEYQKLETVMEDGKKILGNFSANSLGARQTAIRLLAGKSVPSIPKEVQKLIDEAGVIPDEKVEAVLKNKGNVSEVPIPGKAENEVALAVHIDSLPDELSPKAIQILSQIKKLILVFPQGDERAERVVELVGRNVKRFPYVSEIPVQDIQRALEKERGSAKGFLTQNLNLVSDRLKTTREKISYFELDGRQYRETLAENALALILRLTQNPESIHEWQGVIKAASLGNGLVGISFDLGALVERLTVINDSGKSLARAA